MIDQNYWILYKAFYVEYKSNEIIQGKVKSKCIELTRDAFLLWTDQLMVEEEEVNATKVSKA